MFYSTITFPTLVTLWNNKQTNCKLNGQERLICPHVRRRTLCPILIAVLLSSSLSLSHIFSLPNWLLLRLIVLVKQPRKQKLNQLFALVMHSLSTLDSQPMHSLIWMTFFFYGCNLFPIHLLRRRRRSRSRRRRRRRRSSVRYANLQVPEPVGNVPIRILSPYLKLLAWKVNKLFSMLQQVAPLVWDVRLSALSVFALHSPLSLHSLVCPTRR